MEEDLLKLRKEILELERWIDQKILELKQELHKLELLQAELNRVRKDNRDILSRNEGS